MFKLSMKQKTRIEIFGNKVKIKYVDMSHLGLYGCFNAETGEILIDKSLKGHKYTSTLLHEIFHAVCHYGGTRQANLSHDLEEILAEQVSQVLDKTFKFDFKK